jgi:hypothetical protein
MKDKTERADMGHMDSREVLVVSRSMHRKTNSQVAAYMGLGEETVSRYQRNPNPGEHGYDLPIGRIALWNRAVENDMVISWAAQQCGGYFVKVDAAKREDVSVDVQVSKVLKEASDVLGIWSSAMLDGALQPSEAKRLDSELREVITRAEACRESLSMSVGTGRA